MLTSPSKAASIARKNPTKLKRKLAVGETTAATDGSRALICPLTGVVVLSILQNHAAMRLPPKKPGAPETQKKKETRIQTENQKIDIWLWGLCFFFKINFPFENTSF